MSPYSPRLHSSPLSPPGLLPLASPSGGGGGGGGAAASQVARVWLRLQDPAVRWAAAREESSERASGMAFWQARDFLFCGVCGTLLSFDSVRSASCPLCGFKRKAKEIEGKETRYTITDEDIRRELKIEPFVIIESAPKEDERVQRATVNETCPKCRNPKLEYYTKQLRSADEGQTVFYECPECRHKFAVNT